MEPYLSDQEVSAVATKIIDEQPLLQRYNSDFATARIEPPWHGILPNGRTGWTSYPVVQFVIVSDHPRPLQRSFGVRHGTHACAWERAYEKAAKEFRDSVTGDSISPLERIFRAVAAKHIEELESLASIIN
jgi:hypothetical protein